VNPLARVPAVLRGPEGESKCTLEVWQESSSTGRVFTRCRITEDSPDLPDGAYLVKFGHHSVKTWKCGGFWELVFLAPEMGADIFVRPARMAS
jgi:hypothetical protein